MGLSKVVLAGILVLVVAVGVFAADPANTGIAAVCNVVTLIRQVAAVVAIAALTYAGMAFMTSASDPSKHKEAKTMLEYVILGIVVVVMAYYIVSKVFAGSLPINDCPWA